MLKERLYHVTSDMQTHKNPELRINDSTQTNSESDNTSTTHTGPRIEHKPDNWSGRTEKWITENISKNKVSLEETSERQAICVYRMNFYQG